MKFRIWYRKRFFDGRISNFRSFDVIWLLSKINKITENVICRRGIGKIGRQKYMISLPVDRITLIPTSGRQTQPSFRPCGKSPSRLSCGWIKRSPAGNLFFPTLNWIPKLARHEPRSDSVDDQPGVIEVLAHVEP